MARNVFFLRNYSKRAIMFSAGVQQHVAPLEMCVSCRVCVGVYFDELLPARQNRCLIFTGLFVFMFLFNNLVQMSISKRGMYY